ncbi:MAG TPA: TonB-dependent receptor [Kangiella sp.]
MTPSKLLVTISALFLSTNGYAVEPATDTDLFDEELPTILSATRLEQPQSETPASVTILDRELIEASGARNIVEALRLVPGMNVGYLSGNTPEVSIHGLHTDFSRRLQVLVDGRSVFKPALSRVLWGSMSLSIDDVERIEVVRGPNTVAYGANSFLGVINIISRHPADVSSNQATATVGNKGIVDGSVRIASQSEDFSYRMTAGRHSDDGFDLQRNGTERYDDHATDYFRGDMVFSPTHEEQWRFIFGYSQADEQQDLLDVYQTEPYHTKTTQDGFAQLIWDRQLSEEHKIKVNAHYSQDSVDEEWQTCPPALFLTNELGDLYNYDPLYTEQLIAAISNGAPPPSPSTPEAALLTQQVIARFMQLGNTVSCGTANQNFDENKWEIELQDTYTFSPDVRLVSGFSSRRDTIRGESFFEQKLDNDIYRLFANLEWRFTDKALLNFGSMYENDKIIGGEFSPRVGLNYLASQHSSWRFILAKGTRNPDFYEESGHRQYIVRNLSMPVNGSDSFATFYLTPQAMGNLKPETILSREIGWFYRTGNELNFDIKVFYDTLSHTIDGLFGLEGYDPRNANSYTSKGLDLQLDYQFSRDSRLWFSYSYLDLEVDTGRSLRHQAPKQTLSLMYQHHLTDQLQVSTAYYLQDMENRSDFKRWDARISHSFPIDDKELSLSLVLQHNINERSYFDSSTAWDSKTIAFIKASLQF